MEVQIMLVMQVEVLVKQVKNRTGGDGNSTFVGDAASTTAFLKAAVAGTDASNNATTGSSTEHFTLEVVEVVQTKLMFLLTLMVEKAEEVEETLTTTHQLEVWQILVLVLVDNLIIIVFLIIVYMVEVD